MGAYQTTVVLTPAATLVCSARAVAHPHSSVTGESNICMHPHLASSRRSWMGAELSNLLHYFWERERLNMCRVSVLCQAQLKSLHSVLRSGLQNSYNIPQCCGWGWTWTLSWNLEAKQLIQLVHDGKVRTQNQVLAPTFITFIISAKGDEFYNVMLRN